MDSSPTAQRALMAATTFFSPVVSNDGDDSPRVTVHMLAEEPMGDGVAAAELPLGYELVESDTTPVESDHTTSSGKGCDILFSRPYVRLEMELTC